MIRTASVPAARTRRRALGLSVGRALAYAVVTVGAVVFFFPLYWTLVGSIKTLQEVVQIPPVWWPAEPQLGNYPKVWEVVPYGRFFLNTVFITVVATFGQVCSTSLVGYGFARFRFPGRELLFAVVLSTIMLPPELTMIPTFILFKELRWIDTYLPLIVPYLFATGAFFVFLFRQFYLTIPLDLDEAARLDGAGNLRIYWSVIAPLSKPAWAAASIVSFLSHWNDFIHPLIYLNTAEKFTLSLGLASFRSGTVGGMSYFEPRDHLLMAAAVMMTLPTVLVFLLAQRYFVQGIVMSGLKR